MDLSELLREDTEKKKKALNFLEEEFKDTLRSLILEKESIRNNQKHGKTS